MNHRLKIDACSVPFVGTLLGCRESYVPSGLPTLFFLIPIGGPDSTSQLECRCSIVGGDRQAFPKGKLAHTYDDLPSVGT